MKKIFLLLTVIHCQKLTVQAQTLPFNESFENAGSIPIGWTQGYVNSPAGNIDWIYQNGGNGTPASPTSANTGSFNACFQISSYGDDGATTKLISPQINLSTAVSPTLTFWHAQVAWGTDQDQLEVMIRTSATGGWVSIVSYPTNVGSWTKRTISLPSPTSTYYIAFVGTAHFGYGTCVDDVEIFDDAAPDVAVKEWVSPQSNCSLSTTESIMVKVMNYSTQPASNIPIKYSINGGTTYINETITSTINAGDSLYYTFSTTANFSTGGDYNCRSLVGLSGDIYNDNDTVLETVVKTNNITSFPFIENFETGTTEYFILNHGTQANSSIYDEAGNKVLRLEGGGSALGWAGSAGNVTSTEAWTNNLTHQSSAIACLVDATSLSSLELVLDLKQYYSTYDPDYNWFRVLINGVQISDTNGVSNFHPVTTNSDPYQTLNFDLSTYVGTQFNFTLQSSCKYDEPKSTPGDIVFIDNIIFREKNTGSIPLTPSTISGNTTVCSGTTNTYSIIAVSGATSYTWALPSGWSGTSTTTSITTTASSTSGNISVTANNSFGSSSAQIISSTVNSVDVSVTQSGVILTTNAAVATYQWIDCTGNTPISSATNQSFTATTNGNYAVIVTQNSCSDTSTCFNIATIGLSENVSANLLTIYPNPSLGKFIIEMGKMENGNLEIFNVLGDKVFQAEISELKSEINLTVESGVYFLNIKTREELFTQILIIQE